MTKALLFVCVPLLAAAADLSGTWSLKFIRFGEATPAARVEFKVEGTKLGGSINERTLEGTVKDADLKFVVKRPNGSELAKLEGRVQGDEMTGTAETDGEKYRWRANRLKAAEAAQTRTFEPTKFYRQFSGSIAPEMRINPGDTVRTTTVDAGGRDAKGVRRSLGGNPQSGPFYVEGAMPGDTLSVKFLRIRLNRDSAVSGDRIVAGALTANYYRNAKFDDKFDSEWKLDRQSGIGMLAKPTEKLKNFQVKLQPMLGCVAVAPPANQAFRTGFLGSYGGNMDYNGLKEGVTVYLPVYQEGALLFVGDGHAAQGDGELNGDALETSMDVEFKVELVRGKSTQGPRMESDEFLMASGIANSLPEALQIATTELARWLERDYQLNANESGIVLGTSVKYDIAEVVDPLVHIVAKVNKSVLATLKK